MKENTRCDCFRHGEQVVPRNDSANRYNLIYAFGYTILDFLQNSVLQYA